MQVARLFGAPVRIDASWLFVFALLVWTLTPQRAAIAAAVLFVCVVAHEFAHAIVARSFRVKTLDVVLFAFGGASRMEKTGATPSAEAQIAAAGPAFSILLGAICALAAPIFSGHSLAQAIATYFAVASTGLAAFNCLPAYPVDGGRLLHALAWHVTRDRVRGTRLAVKVSIATGSLAAAGSVVLLFTGHVVEGVWTALLSWFVIRSAQIELVADVQAGPLASIRCADLLDPPSGAFQPDTNCSQALARMIEMRRHAAPVAVGRRLLGMLALDDFAKLGPSDPEYVYVSAIMTPVARLKRLAPDVTGLEAFNQLASSGHPQLPVVDRNGTLLGFITRETLARTMEKAVK